MRSLGLIALLVFSYAAPAIAQNTVSLLREDCTESPRLLTKGCPTLELSGVYLEGAWDFHGQPPNQLEGGTAAVSFAVRDGWGIVIEVLGVRVTEKPSSAFLGGGSILFRKRVAEHHRLTLFVEGGLGSSYATLEVPVRGTQFNYLVQAGGGMTYRVGRRVSAILNFRLFHLSNLSLNGPDHNPDIQALGGHAGILIWL